MAMREFIKYTIEFPLKKVLLYAKLFSSLSFYIEGVEGNVMLSVKTQEHISRGNDVD